MAGAQLARKVDVEGAAGRDVATGKALHLTVALQVGGADAGWGAGGTAAPISSSGWPLHVHLGAWGASTGVTCGFWGSTTEQEAGEQQVKGTIRSHASRRDREKGTGIAHTKPPRSSPLEVSSEWGSAASPQHALSL